MRERGVTLPELMVTVALVGVLASLAIAGVRRDPVGDRARAVAGLLQEARRKAISAGPIGAAAAALGMTARTQVELRPDGAILFLLVEDPAPAQWVEISSVRLRPGASEPVIWRSDASVSLTAQGSMPGRSTTPRTTSCYPSGRCDGVTVYLSRRNAADLHDADLYKIFMYPLSGTTTTVKGW